ncbi:MAG: hypothetical protein K1X55_08925 [Chitinophagales bacterium]|nr:hypothetical protein [Chitinophagales bacterium]
MKTIVGYIDGFPLYWDLEEEKRLYGDAFLHNGKPIFKDMNTKEIITFGEDLNAVRQSIAETSPFGEKSIFYRKPPPAKEDFDSKDLFYTDPIDFAKLLSDIQQNRLNNEFLFDYEKYKSSLQKTIEIRDPEHIQDVAKSIEVDRNFITKENRKIILSGKLSTVKYYTGRYSLSSSIDDEGKVSFSWRCRFQDTDQYVTKEEFVEGDVNTKDDDYSLVSINDKYLAWIITANNAEDLFAIVEYADASLLTFFKTRIADQFNKWWDKYNGNGAMLKALYAQAPQWIIDKRDVNSLWKDFLTLLKADKGNPFVDSTMAVLKIFSALSQTTYLIDKFKDNSALLLETYRQIDGAAEEMAGFELSNKELFCMMLTGAANAGKGLQVKNTLFKIDANHRVDANILFKDKEEKSEQKIWLQQQKTETREQKIFTSINYYSTPTTIQKDVIIDDGEGAYYNPLDMVSFHFEGDELPTLVPALYIMCMAEQAEWKQVKQRAELVFYISMIALSVGSLGAGATGLVAIADYVMIVTGAIDTILIGIPDCEEKRAFQKYWQPINMVVNGGVCLPLLAKTILTNGPKLYGLAVKAGDLGIEATAFIGKAIENAVKNGIKIPNFTTEVLLKSVQEVYRVSRNYFITLAGPLNRLYQIGVLMVKGELKVGKAVQEGYAVIYKGEVIFSGSAKEMFAWLRRFWSKSVNGTKVALEEMVLENYFKISKEIIGLTKGKPVLQNTSNLDELYAAAEVANGELKILTEKLAIKTKGKAGFRREDVNNGLKDKKRVLEKLSEYENESANNILDIAGSKIVYNNLDEVYEALNVIKDEVTILRIKDRFLNVLSSRYRDILMNIKMSNGHIVEFRLHLKAMDEASNLSHPLYEEYRTLESLSKKRALTDVELKRMNFLDDEQIRIHNNAWEKYFKIKNK